MNHQKHIKHAVLGVLLLAMLIPSVADAQEYLRMASYNVEGQPSNTTEINRFKTVIQAIGNEDVDGRTRTLDVLSVQETNSGDLTNKVNALNSLYGSGTYSSFIASYGTGIYNAVIYNTDTLNLLGTKTVGGILTRGAARVHLQSKYDTAQEFYVYSAHLKAGSGSTDSNRRALEANAIRSDADNLGDGKNVIYMGDFNVYSSFESGFSNFLLSGNGKANDPINRLGNWHDNSSFKDVHTQDPTGTLGGMDDRFDFQLITDELLDNIGMDYVDGSYHAFGNYGLHNLNGTIASGSAPSNSTTIALRDFSDHLPVVADYIIPAIPEPTTVVFFGSALPLLIMRRKRAA